MSTKRLQFGSPNWKLLKRALDNADIYWFLTDPVDDEEIAVKVFKSHKLRFLEIAEEQTDAEFRITDC